MRNACIAIAALAAAGSAQVRFSLSTPQELGIDTIPNYLNNSFVDYNGDGWLDFFADVVYLSDGTGAGFTRLDSTRIGESELVDWADFDGDGDPDLVTNKRYGGATFDTNFVLIYRNEGPPHYGLKNVSESLGLGRMDTIFDRDLVDPAWFDYDGDGWLDFFLSSYEWPNSQHQGRPDYLFHNDSGLSFTDVSNASHVSWVPYCSRGVSLSDFDEDGDVDVFVSVYRLEPNLLWQNQGDGTFTDVAGDKGVKGLYLGGYYGHNIGTAVADYDNDGHMDMFTPITHHASYPGDSTGHLWISNGPPNWDYTCCFAGSGMLNTEIGSSPSTADIDNDGDVDILWTNLYGAPGEDFYMYRNDGGCRFTDISDSVGLGPRQRINYGIWADYNNDGAVDLFWARYLAGTYYYEFWENSGGTGNHWLEVDLVGRPPNTSALGTRLDAYAGGLRVVREVLHNQGNHYGSMFVARQHFGLGQNTTVDSLVIRWPDKTLDVLYDLDVDTIMRIYQQPQGIRESKRSRSPARALFVSRGQEFKLDRDVRVVDVVGRTLAASSRSCNKSWIPAAAGVFFLAEENGRVQKLIVR